MSHLAVLPGVESVTPISKPFKLTSREFHPADTRHRGGRHAHRGRLADGHGRALLGREPRPAAAHRGRRRRGRRHRPAWRRLQAAHEPLLVPGPGRGRAALPGRGARAHRPAHRHRGHGALAGRDRGAACRHPPGGRPQHAELPAAHGRRPGITPGAPQARPVGDHRGVAHGRRVHRLLGQPGGHPLRARHPHLRDLHAQHARPRGRAAAAPAHAPARHRRSLARHRQALAGALDGPGGGGGRRRRHHGRGPSRTPTTPSPTASSR